MKKDKLHKPKWRIKFSILKYHRQFFFTWNLKLLWKEKYETPRIQLVPHINIEWLWFSLDCQKGNDDEWEWWLWLHKYNNGNLREALSSWPWKSIKSN